MKFITPFSDEEQLTLHEAYRHHPSFRVRQRAHAVLLNNRGYKKVRLSELFEIRHETVSSWLHQWETDGVVGLFDPPRSGRPPTFNHNSLNKLASSILSIDILSIQCSENQPVLFCKLKQGKLVVRMTLHFCAMNLTR